MERRSSPRVGRGAGPGPLPSRCKDRAIPGPAGPQFPSCPSLAGSPAVRVARRPAQGGFPCPALPRGVEPASTLAVEGPTASPGPAPLSRCKNPVLREIRRWRQDLWANPAPLLWKGRHGEGPGDSEQDGPAVLGCPPWASRQAAPPWREKQGEEAPAQGPGPQSSRARLGRPHRGPGPTPGHPSYPQTFSLPMAVAMSWKNVLGPPVHTPGCTVPAGPHPQGVGGEAGLDSNPGPLSSQPCCCPQC